MSTIRVVNLQHTDATEPNIVLLQDGTSVFASGITISGGTNLTVSGTAEFASGTVSAPGVTFIDDNNTGLYSPAADTVAITTTATERLRIDSSGNVGIGTTSPSQKLQVTSGNILLDGTDQYIYLSNDSDQWLSANAASNYLRIGTANQERMRIDSSGRLSLGNTANASMNSAMDNFVLGSGSGNEGMIIYSGNSSSGFIGFNDAAATSTQGVIEYNHSGNHMGFRTADAERMRIDSSGRVGINASSPGRTLDVDGVIRADGTSGSFELGGNSSTPSVGCAIHRPANNTMAFVTGTTERMRIDNAGNVGIGTTSPTHQLTVHNASTTAGTIEANRFSARDNYGNASGLGNGIFSPATNTLAFATNSTERMRIFSDGGINIKKYLEFRNQGDTTQAGYLGNAADLVTGASANDFALRAQVNLLFSTNGATERMRIDTSGRLMLGRTSATHRLSLTGTANDNSAELQLTASSVASGYIGPNANGLNIGTDTAGIVFKTGVTGGGSVGATGTERMRIDSSGYFYVQNMSVGGSSNVHWSSSNGQFFVTSSSERFKHSISDYDKGLTELMQLRPKYFTYNDEPGQKQRAGFIAEDFHNLGLSEYVEYWNDDNGNATVPSEINYPNMVAILVKSLQQATTRIETLEQRLTEAGIA